VPASHAARRAVRAVFASLIVSLVALAAAPFDPPARGQDAPDAGLPERGPIIDIDAPERALYKIAIPQLLGDSGLGAQAAEVVRRDLTLVSLFTILDARSFLADPAREGLGIAPASWTSVGAQGVIKGEITGTGGALTVEMRLYELARGSEPTLSKTYQGGAGELRGFMHDFANEVLRVLTGQAGAFGTRLTFARRVGPGRKDVYVGDFDGEGVGRVSSGTGVAMLPAFGPGGVWYSVLTKRGMFITRTGREEQPVIAGDGMNMGVTFCGARALFVSTRDGNSEIYSAAPDGSDVRRLTRHPGIDVSPACGPGGQVAFVSDRNGGPQIFVMDGNGGGVRRVTFRGNHNQTPAWCPLPGKNLLAFTGRDGGMDIFTVDIVTQQYTRITQGQGVNKDPAFSPDCRMIAFASSRGGIFLSNPEGLNQNLVIPGGAETIRWSR
jgi:TolB protein